MVRTDTQYAVRRAWLLPVAGAVGLVLAAQGLAEVPALAAAPEITVSAVVGDGTAASCTEAAFDIALATVQSGGGGTISFHCGGQHIIIFSSSRAVSSQVAIDGGGQITLSGGNATRLFTVSTGARLELRNITLSNGYAATGDGGAIRSNGALHLVNATFRDNRTTEEGGSGGAIVSTGPVTAINSRFENNRAANGGAVYLRFAGGVGTFAGTVFKNNYTLSATNGWGGAILLWDGAQLTASGCKFDGNSARFGGALHNSFNNVTVAIERSLLVANEAILGGGVYQKLGTLMITDSIISANNANWYGGGLYAEGGVISFLGSTLVGNIAGTGGGIDIGTSSAAELSILNSTLTGNTATSIDDGGGAIYVIGLNGSVTVNLRHVTITNNAGNVSGLALDTLGTIVDVSIYNTVLDGNSSSTCYLRPSIASAAIAHNSLWSDTSCNFGTSQQNHPNTPANLAPLANNGGPTLTHAPLPGSTLIDNGLCLPGVTTDQRGASRPHGPACDIGAVEFGSALPDRIFSDRFRAP